MWRSSISPRMLACRAISSCSWRRQEIQAPVRYLRLVEPQQVGAMSLMSAITARALPDILVRIASRYVWQCFCVLCFPWSYFGLDSLPSISDPHTYCKRHCFLCVRRVESSLSCASTLFRADDFILTDHASLCVCSRLILDQATNCRS